jgi:hypothetical protein
LACFFDQPLAPGAVFTIDPKTPLKLKVADQAPGPYTYGAYAAAIPLANDETAAQAVRKSSGSKGGGSELRLVRAASPALVPGDDLNNYDNAVEFAVAVPKHAADSVAIGAGISGSAGETKSIQVGVRDDGPADVLIPSESWALSANVTLPAGVTVLAVDQQCAPIIDGKTDWDKQGKPDGLSYQCFPPEDVTAGHEYLFPFKVKVTGSAGAAGSIVVDGGVQDPDTGNNTAAIMLTVATGGTGGGEGGLPVTGARVGVVAGIGALLVVAGAVALVLVRRRRITTVAE